MTIIINSVFKNKFSSAYSYLYDVCHLQEKLELKLFWTIILFPTRANGSLLLIQVWHSQYVSVLEFLISQIPDNLSPKHFLCIVVWQLLQTKYYLFCCLLSCRHCRHADFVLDSNITISWWLWVGFLVNFFFLRNSLTNFIYLLNQKRGTCFSCSFHITMV